MKDDKARDREYIDEKDQPPCSLGLFLVVCVVAVVACGAFIKLVMFYLDAYVASQCGRNEVPGKVAIILVAIDESIEEGEYGKVY